ELRRPVIIINIIHDILKSDFFFNPYGASGALQLRAEPRDLRHFDKNGKTILADRASKQGVAPRDRAVGGDRKRLAGQAKPAAKAGIEGIQPAVRLKAGKGSRRLLSEPGKLKHKAEIITGDRNDAG